MPHLNHQTQTDLSQKEHSHDALSKCELSKESESIWILSENGPFSQSLPGFTPRKVQQQMAQAIEQCIKDKGQLAVEAGTGTGKTLAYLIPALVSQKKVIISTGTKNLQDQLFHRDLPLVVKTLDLPLDIALLKGRVNYLCLHRLDQTLAQGMLESRYQASQIQRLKQWSNTTLTGDLAQSSGLAEDSPLISLVTSTADNCLGNACPDYDDCFLMKARKKALDADVLVVNHYLFYADLSLKEEGFGNLLPEADVLIFDESHQLPDIARSFLGERFSSHQLKSLSQDIKVEYLTNVTDCKSLDDLASQLEKQSADWRLIFGVESGKRENWRFWQQKAEIIEMMTSVTELLEELRLTIEPQLGRSPGLDSCYTRSQVLFNLLTKLMNKPAMDQVQWIETFGKSFAISRTPLEIRKELSELMLRHQGSAWVFTSATLSVGDSLDYFLKELSLEAAKSLILESPFDYPNQSLLYMPRGLPEPNQPFATQQAMEQILPLLEMSRGRAFILVTSYRALEITRDLLQEQICHPILVQGEIPKTELLQTFRDTEHAVLIATSSFWEGIDVAGEDLSLVIIDRLPFSSLSDPVLQARGDYLRSKGRDPFKEFQLTDAIISLKQGAGRLIRTETDQGVLVVLDPRLVSRRYGEDFISSLPPFARTRDLERVENFFKALI